MARNGVSDEEQALAPRDLAPDKPWTLEGTGLEVEVIALRNAVLTIQEEKAKNEKHWSWLSTSLLVGLTLVLTVATIISISQTDARTLSAALAGATGAGRGAFTRRSLRPQTYR
jgi:hypothetical protein